MGQNQHATYGHHATRSKPKPLKILAIMLGCVLALLLVAYAGVAFYFTGRFMPNSTAGSINLSLMSASDAEQALSKAMENYTLTVSGQGFELKLSAAEAGLAADEAAIVDDMLADANPWLWPFQIRSQHDESAKLVASSNGSSLADAIGAAVADFNATATLPTNATVSYDSAASTFVVLPDSMGTALDADAVLKVASTALSTLTKQANITADQLAQPTVRADDTRLAQTLASANAMVAANLTLSMGGTEVGRVDASLVSQWITSDENASVTLDESQLSAWVDKLAETCTTVGTARSYTRADGKAIKVSGGVYGWEVDHDALLATVKEAVLAGSEQSVEVPTVTHGDAFTAAGAQDWGKRYLDIDLSEQHARFYDASGTLVWESDVVSGIPDGAHDTPTGVYWMNRKESPSTLTGYTGDTKIYETEVQYWMPFVGGAIGLHDADWQPAFGGTLFRDGAGSHGCVNLPPDKAAELYGMVEGGDAVVCHW